MVAAAATAAAAKAAGVKDVEAAVVREATAAMGKGLLLEVYHLW